MAKINCIYKEPGKKARAKMIENKLEAFQAAVGGRIEAVPLVNGILMLVNEEGKLRGLEHNFYVGRTGGRISFTPDASQAHDDIWGPIVVLRMDGEEFASLDPMEQDEILENFGCWNASEACVHRPPKTAADARKSPRSKFIPKQQ